METLYAATAALSLAIGRPVSLAELLTSDEPIQINDKLTVEPAALPNAVSGEPAIGATSESLRKLGG